MTNKKVTKKKQIKKSNIKKPIKKNQAKKVEVKKPRINYKKKYNKTLDIIKNLEINLIEQKRENQININSFQEKAKTFQKKAQKEVNKIKKELQKSLQKERSELKKYSSQKLFESCIDVLLNIELAINVGKKNKQVKAYTNGFNMLINQLYENFENFGLKKISPKIGEEFNPSIHHAIETKKGKKNKIIKIKKEGFELHDRILKPAMVIIGK